MKLDSYLYQGNLLGSSGVYSLPLTQGCIPWWVGPTPMREGESILSKYPNNNPYTSMILINIHCPKVLEHVLQRFDPYPINSPRAHQQLAYQQLAQWTGMSIMQIKNMACSTLHLILLSRSCMDHSLFVDLTIVLNAQIFDCVTLDQFSFGLDSQSSISILVLPITLALASYLIYVYIYIYIYFAMWSNK